MITKKSHSKKRILLLVTSFVVMLGLLIGFLGPSAAQAWGLVPVTSIVSVNTGVSVTVSGANFPAGQVFTVRMGPYGTYGAGGTVVGSYDTSAGTSFTTAYAIPGALATADRIAIRFESASGYVSYNWFNNTATGVPTGLPSYPTAVPGYAGYPTFDVTSVASGSTVTVLTHNMPAGQEFTVRMGDFGTLAIGGTVVGTTPTTGGSYSLTFNIPSWLAAKPQVAIRMDGPNGYYYAFNWFYNNSTTVVSNPVPTTYPGVPGYVGIPTISIAAVVRDSTVTIYGYNFPAGQTFNVRMGPYGSYGMGGTLVTSVDTGAGGSFSATYSIPASLAGSQQIAIRLETANGYFYAYNWFWNNTTN
jgi:hypothetical protein